MSESELNARAMHLAREDKKRKLVKVITPEYFEACLNRVRAWYGQAA